MIPARIQVERKGLSSERPAAPASLDGVAPPARSSDAPHAAFKAVVALHFLVMFAFSAFRHRHYGSHAYDLGAYHQIFWNWAYRGSLWNEVERMHQWSAHLELGLLPLWLPYRIVATPLWLFALQSGACALAAVAVERLARRATGDRRLALAAAAATLLTPQLLFAQIYDFHSITVCVLPMAFLAHAVAEKRRLQLWVAALFALSLREQMGLAVIAAAGAWLWVHGRSSWRTATALGVIGAGVFLAEVLWIIPSFADGGPFRYAARYGRLGGSPEAAVSFLLQHPLRFLALPFEGARPLYLLKLGAGALPLLLLSFGSLRRAWPLLIAAPLLAVQLYADDEPVWNLRYHYGAPVVPLLAAAAVLSLGWVHRRSARWAFVLAMVWVGTNATVAAIRMAQFATEPGGPLDLSVPGSPRDRALRRAMALVPKEASVSAQDGLVPHLAERERIHQWPDGEWEDDFILLDAQGIPGETPQEPITQAIERLRSDERFEPLLDEEGVLLVRRRKPDLELGGER